MDSRPWHHGNWGASYPADGSETDETYDKADLASAERKLLRTKATTIAGVVALLRYNAEFLVGSDNRGSSIWPGPGCNQNENGQDDAANSCLRSRRTPRTNWRRLAKQAGALMIDAPVGTRRISMSRTAYRRLFAF